MSSPEQLGSNAERSVEAQEAAAERIEELRQSPEKHEVNVESSEKSAEKARVEALESALSVEAGSKEKHSGKESTPPRRGTISKSQKKESYKKQMEEVHAQLSPASRAFSKLIHNPIVEKTSEVVGSTVARPNAILAGAVCAFILTLAVYVLAKNIGYGLSGFETIAAFAIGWIIGLLYDYFRLLATGKK